LAVRQVLAIRFAEHRKGNRGDFFHGAGAAPWSDPVGIDYHIWVIRTDDGDIVVDAGFTREVAVKRSRPDYHRSPSEALALVGIDLASVGCLIVSHLHYDHAGDTAAFPAARFVLQDRELAFWTGRHIYRRELKRHIETDDILRMVGYSLDGRVQFVDGDRTIVPGVSVHLVGGHTPGMQVVRVETEQGPIVLASDASHLAENIRNDMPTSVFTDLPGVYEGFDRMIELAGGDVTRVYPGHEPGLVDRLEPLPGFAGVAGIVA
jgi:glyoxylase-like metal-dependent hydrolase (beta-lactamase superfamily II)